MCFLLIFFNSKLFPEGGSKRRTKNCGVATRARRTKGLGRGKKRNEGSSDAHTEVTVTFQGCTPRRKIAMTTRKIRGKLLWTDTTARLADRGLHHASLKVTFSSTKAKIFAGTLFNFKLTTTHLGIQSTAKVYELGIEGYKKCRASVFFWYLIFPPN